MSDFTGSVHDCSRGVFSEEPDQRNCGSDLQHKDGGDANVEFGMAGLVPEGIHTAEGSHAAADKGNGHQGGFRDAPEFFLGFLLVNEHKQKTCRINYKEVCK